MADVVEKAWQRYLIALQKYPLRTKATTAGVLAGCSDLVAQKLSGAKKLQLRRSLLMLLYGLVYGGPFGHFFHKLMERLFPRRDTPTLVKKVNICCLLSSKFMTRFWLRLQVLLNADTSK
jgi:peroxisomal membrane protein 2